MAAIPRSTSRLSAAKSPQTRDCSSRGGHMITPERRTFLLPGRTLDVLFFRPLAFLHTLRDHFLTENEPWERVFHLKRKSLENLRQQIASEDVGILGAAAAKVYPRAVEVLAQAIDWSGALPVYVEFIQERSQSADREKNRETSGFYFIGESGFLVVVAEGVVRYGDVRPWKERRPLARSSVSRSSGIRSGKNLLSQRLS